MQNARKYDERITIGGVPSLDDLQQLKDIGYRTLVDLRDEEEKFGGFIGKKALGLGLSYITIPIYREEIQIEDVTTFYETVYEKGTAPLYCFSRFGKRPLAFLLLFEAVAKKKPLVWIYKKASHFGLNLQGDLSLQVFLTSFYNSRSFKPIIEQIQKMRPDLFISM